ncbi:hypothetical protein [Pseudodesulfovibrio tunisiensis]|uniref:hypothetical protein n=1 Tax=Pseudodesulfovibrio tunisiensis TaxID=463192 RepID=UPI001FB207DC|nr:hypothetical protein [Pseudodesulfovibrio tunisiensis]
MPNRDTQLPDADQRPAQQPSTEYTPKEHSLGEQIRYAILVAAVAGLFFGLLWLFER